MEGRGGEETKKKLERVRGWEDRSSTRREMGRGKGVGGCGGGDRE